MYYINLYIFAVHYQSILQKIMEYQIIFSIVLILLAFTSILSKSTSMTETAVEDAMEINTVQTNILESEQEEC